MTTQSSFRGAPVLVLARRITSRAGVPFGGLVALRTLNGYPAWWDLALWFVMPAALLGALLTGLALAWTRLFRRGWFSRALLFALLEGAAFASGYGLLYASARVPHGRWVQLPQAPARVTGFVGGSCVARDGMSNVGVSIATDAGTFHLRSPADGEWSPGDVPRGPKDSAWNWSCAEEAEKPYLRGEAIAAQRVMGMNIECAWSQHYVLLDDGSLHTLGDGGCGMTALGLLMFAAIILFVGGGLAFAVADRAWSDPPAHPGTAG